MLLSVATSETSACGFYFLVPKLRDQVGQAWQAEQDTSNVAPVAKGSKVVIVESPAKARKLQNYLGSDWTVLASYGHVRSLPRKNGAVDVTNNFEMDWTSDARQRQHIGPIKSAVRGASEVVLATDPDREGEAISWHIWEVLQASRLAGNLQVSRITFNEVTKKAVLAAMAAPRQVSQALVDAYRARLALDFLIGFSVSPLLWRKLPSARSAGRVQSVALRLVTERESEIGAFQAQKYWSVDAMLQAHNAPAFPARLTKVDGQGIGQMGFNKEADAQSVVQRLRDAQLQVRDVSRRESKRSPQPPFTTSTMQQAGSSRLGFTPSVTMSLAQRLYEGLSDGGEGLITYMRTDGVDISPEAMHEIRTAIAQDHGAEFVPQSERTYKTKAKNAQEAHAAVQPTNVFRTAGIRELQAADDSRLRRLYALIRARTMACQMTDAIMQQVGVDVDDQHSALMLRATASDVKFPGFLAAFGTVADSADSSESDEDGDDSSAGPQGPTRAKATDLGALQAGTPLLLQSVQATEHSTRPPPRYTEAALVKALEARGIGRPSTYASTIKLLQERGYVTREGRQLHAQPSGRLLVAFMSMYFGKYIDYDFTSDMERLLDDVSGGKAQWRELVQAFWEPLEALVSSASKEERVDVVAALDKLLEPIMFPPQAGQAPEEARKCPACDSGRLALKTSSTGAFVGCSSYPECKFSRTFAPADASEAGVIDASGMKTLGPHPQLPDHVITLRNGRFGAYVQLDSAADPEADLGTQPASKGKGANKDQDKPRRAGVPKGMAPEAVSLDLAMELLSWPRDLGFGPYVRQGDVFASIPKDVDAREITLEEACTLLTKKLIQNALRPPRAKGKAAASKGGRKASAKQSAVKTSSPEESLTEGTPAAEKKIKGRAAATAVPTKVSKGRAKAAAKTPSAGKATSSTAQSEAPKRRNPFLEFCSEHRPAVKAEHPDLPLGQVSKLLGEKWRSLSDEERLAYRKSMTRGEKV
ncbi:hypothetical protein WJX73_010571 [Symbiochloris irregularis]|uniref:DNA topoisomerase n=1 Tax=Symbiochloris irregularis TaxID=706552 RepID=A0AAW1PIU8_9CHLO